MTDQLNDCPFCGGKVAVTYVDQIDSGSWCAHIECDGCDMDFSRTYSAPNASIAEEEVIDLWNTRPTAVASHAEGEAKPVAEMVYFKRKGSVFEDCLPVISGQHGNHVRSDLITRVVPLYAHPPRSGDEADYREIARLIGQIFFYGDFKAETYNERLLEALLRKTGNFHDTQQQADAAMADRGDDK